MSLDRRMIWLYAIGRIFITEVIILLHNNLRDIGLREKEQVWLRQNFGSDKTVTSLDTFLFGTEVLSLLQCGWQYLHRYSSEQEIIISKALCK